MSQSLAKLLTHAVFSTKNRRPLLAPEHRQPLAAYFTGIFKKLESPSIAIESVEDHVHILFTLSKNQALADVMEEVKKGTSKWLKTLSPSLADFYWQGGYGAFSASQSNVD